MGDNPFDDDEMRSLFFEHLCRSSPELEHLLLAYLSDADVEVLVQSPCWTQLKSLNRPNSQLTSWGVEVMRRASSNASPSCTRNTSALML